MFDNLHEIFHFEHTKYMYMHEGAWGGGGGRGRHM